MRFNGLPIYALLTMALCASLALRAHAEDDGGAFFVGANLGRAPIQDSNTQYQTELATSASSDGSLAFTKASLTKRNQAASVDMGYMFGPYLGVQASYYYFGRVWNQLTGTFTPTDAAAENVYASTRLASRGPALGILLRVPVIEHVDVNFQLADYYAHTTYVPTLVAAEHTASTITSNGSSLLAGVGAAYTFGGHWMAKLDFTRINQAGSGDTLKYDIDMVSVGVTYAF